MKTIFLIVIFFYSNIFFSQNKIYLSELDTTLNNEIKKQGFKLFKKNLYYNKKIKDYKIINSFWVSHHEFNVLDFSSEKELLKKLFFDRTSKCKLVNVIHWNIINKDTLFNSDFKNFYKFNLIDSSFDYIRESIKKFNFSNISYTFYIEMSNGFIEFIVLNDGSIFVFDSKKELMYNFKDFTNLLKQSEYLNEFYPDFFRKQNK